MQVGRCISFVFLRKGLIISDLFRKGLIISDLFSNLVRTAPLANTAEGGCRDKELRQRDRDTQKDYTCTWAVVLSVLRFVRLEVTACLTAQALNVGCKELHQHLFQLNCSSPPPLLTLKLGSSERALRHGDSDSSFANSVRGHPRDPHVRRRRHGGSA